MSLNLFYSVKEGFRGLRRARAATALSVSTMAIALTLMGVFLVVTVNVQQIVQLFRERMTVEVFFDPGIDTGARGRLEADLKNTVGVSVVRYLSSKEALEIFKQELGEDPVEILGENPLPPSFQVYFDPSQRSAQSIQKAVESFKFISGVEDVVFHNRAFQLIDHYSRIILLVDVTLFILVLIAAIALVANTLRLTILSQKDMIQVMELVGATRKFIKRPYAVQGVVQGGLAGLFASLIVFILVKLISLRFQHLIDPNLLILFPLGLGLTLGWIGSHIALVRFMKA